MMLKYLISLDNTNYDANPTLAASFSRATINLFYPLYTDFPQSEVGCYQKNYPQFRLLLLKKLIGKDLVIPSKQMFSSLSGM